MSSKQPSLHGYYAEAGVPLLERNRYFTGKFMTARDFQSEQEYLRSRMQLHNRMLHGWGIVGGLEVKVNPNRACQSTTVVVKGGMALDCFGREIVVSEDLVFPVPRQQAPRSTEGDEERRLLCLVYGEEEIEQVPSLYSESSAGGEAAEANRIRETPQFRLLRLDEVSQGCWEGGTQVERCRDDCEDQIPGPVGALLTPECPCGSAVPLALLTYRLGANDDPITIHMGGRRRLPVHADQLTHVVATNWTHAAGMSFHHLREQLHGRLEIRFDRRIRPATETFSTGVSEYTMSVQYGGVQDAIRFLPFDVNHPPEIRDECVATFHIDPNYLDPRRMDDLRDKVIYVRLNCDLVVDCRGLPVDGSFLGGELPTHSGRMGGVFESWFYIEEEGTAPEHSPGNAAMRRRSRGERRQA